MGIHFAYPRLLLYFCRRSFSLHTSCSRYLFLWEVQCYVGPYSSICMYLHTDCMPMKSISKTLFDNYSNKDVNIHPESTHYLLLNSFQSNPSPRFYKALKELGVFFEMSKIQNGVYQFKFLNVAYLVINLIKRYNGKCKLFSVSEIPSQDLVEYFGEIKW
jgi:hypothetical protein